MWEESSFVVVKVEKRRCKHDYTTIIGIDTK